MDIRLTRRQVLHLTAGTAAFGAGGALDHRSARAAPADSYTLIDIAETDPNPVGPDWLGANGMSAGGVVAGNMWVSEEKRSPWVYVDGKLRRIKTGTYGGLLSAINDDGVLAGRELLGWHEPGMPWGRPVLWVEGEKEILPYPDALPAAAESGRAYDINNEGVAVGAVQIPGGASYPVVWRNGEPVVLPSLFDTGEGTAMCISADGLIAGVAGNSDSGQMGVVWRDDAVLPIMPVTGTDGPVQPYGFDVDGAILGVGWSGSGMYAMRWASEFDSPELLSPLVEGQTLGAAMTGDGAGLLGGTVMVTESDQRAVLWDNGAVIDLNTLIENLGDAQLLVVRAFSDDGWIAGSARFADNTIHAVLLEPVE